MDDIPAREEVYVLVPVGDFTPVPRAAYTMDREVAYTTVLEAVFIRGPKAYQDKALTVAKELTEEEKFLAELESNCGWEALQSIKYILYARQLEAAGISLAGQSQ